MKETTLACVLVLLALPLHVWCMESVKPELGKGQDVKGQDVKGQDVQTADGIIANGWKALFTQQKHSNLQFSSVPDGVATFTKIAEKFDADMRAAHATITPTRAAVVHQQMAKGLLRSVGRFIARLSADWSDVATRFGFATDAPITDLLFTGSDPHGDFDSVIILTVGRDPAVRVVYKPSSVDGHYWFQAKNNNDNKGGNDSPTTHSLVELINAVAKPVPALPTFVVYRRKDQEGMYGYLEFVDRKGNLPVFRANNDDTTWKAYSHQLGAFCFGAWLMGMGDLHMENLMSTTAGPYAIDAEVAFQPMPVMRLESTGIFSGAFSYGAIKQGATNQEHNAHIYKAVTTKSTLTDEYKGKYYERLFPDAVSVVAGFDQAVRAFAEPENAAKLNKWLDAVVRDNPTTRLVVLRTPECFAIRAKYLYPAIADKTPVCSQVVGELFARDPRWNSLSIISVFNTGCRQLSHPESQHEPYAGVSIPAWYIRATEQRLYLPDLQHTTSLQGIPTTVKTSLLSDVYAQAMKKMAVTNDYATVFEVSGAQGVAKRIAALPQVLERLKPIKPAWRTDKDKKWVGEMVAQVSAALDGQQTLDSQAIMTRLVEIRKTTDISLVALELRYEVLKFRL